MTRRFTQLQLGVHAYAGTEASATTYRSRCGCGWRSPRRPTRRRAVAAWTAHANPRATPTPTLPVDADVARLLTLRNTLAAHQAPT